MKNILWGNTKLLGQMKSVCGRAYLRARVCTYVHDIHMGVCVYVCFLVFYFFFHAIPTIQVQDGLTRTGTISDPQHLTNDKHLSNRIFRCLLK